MDFLTCTQCNASIDKKYISANICPFLDSMGSPAAFVDCPQCDERNTLMLQWKGVDHVTIQQIEIIAIPGPEYKVLDSLNMEISDCKFGWFLNREESFQIWKKEHWSSICHNWICFGLPYIFVSCRRPSAVEAISLELQTFSQVNYQQIIETLEIDGDFTIEIGTEKTDEEKVVSIGKEVFAQAYQFYHGKTLNRKWLHESFPPLLKKLQKLAKYLPANEEDNLSLPPSINFGTVVKYDEDTCVIIRPHDCECSEALMIKGDFTPASEEEWVSIPWDELGVPLAQYQDLPESLQKIINPYKKGVTIDGSYWSNGIRFLDDEDQKYFENGEWNKLTLGSAKMVRKFFGKDSKVAGTEEELYRILIHIGNDWCDWLCFEAVTEADVDAKIEETKSTYSVPKSIASGVYELKGRCITKIEVYLGRKLIKEFELVRGQGQE